MFQCLQESQLYANMVKCKLFQIEARYLGHFILGEGIVVDPSKI